MQPWHTSQNAFVNLLNYLLITSHPRPKPQRDSAPSRDGLSCHTPGHLWTSEAGKNGESWRIPLLACHVWLIGLQKELAWNLRVMSKQLGTTAMYSERFEVLEPPSPLGKGPTFLDVWQAISSTEKKKQQSKHYISWKSSALKLDRKVPDRSCDCPKKTEMLNKDTDGAWLLVLLHTNSKLIGVIFCIFKDYS